MLDLRILGLNWQGTACLVRNDTTMNPLGDRDQRGLPNAGDLFFGAKLKACWLRTVSYFSHFAFWYNFWSSKSVFMNIKCRFLWEKARYFNTNPADMHLTSGQFSFSRLLNPDRSVQLAGPPAVCKVYPRAHTMHKLHDKTAPNNYTPSASCITWRRWTNSSS